MGLEQSKLLGTSTPRDEPQDTDAQADEGTEDEVATSEVVTSAGEVVAHEEAERTSMGDQAIEQPMSLQAQRELVRTLRNKNAQPESSDAQLRAEMEQAGITDQRDDGAGSNDDTSDETDSDTTTGTESEEEPSAARVDDDEEHESSVPLRTKHELVDDYIPEPPFTQVDTQDMPKLQRIGHVHSIVDNVVLVEQDENVTETVTPYELDVLDSESLLCMHDGRVLGLVYETFGSVKQPMYTVRFREASDIDTEVIEIGKDVYFLPTSSTFVQTRAIHTKGSDASNMWDEEVADDEVEYSDDEEEREAKRYGKKSRTSRAQTDVDPATASLGPLGASASRGGGRKRRGQARPQPAPYAQLPNWSSPTAWYGQSASSQINSRFADQWFADQWFMPQAGSMSFGMMPSPYGMPPYSPHHPSMTQHDSYNPYQPGTGTGGHRQSQPPP